MRLDTERRELSTTPTKLPQTLPQSRKCQTRCGHGCRPQGSRAALSFGRSARPASCAPAGLRIGSVANVVQAYAARAGLDATVFSGHSLRSGFLTSAAANGASIFKMMDVSRHKSVDTHAGLCSGCRVIQGSCGYRFALKRALRRCRVGKVQRHFLYL